MKENMKISARYIRRGFLSEDESKEIPGILQSYEKTAEFMGNNAKIQRMAEGLRSVVELGEEASHVHCKDRGEGFSSVAVGEGSIPIAELIGCLKARGYDAYLAIEHFDAPNQEECIRRLAVFLRETIALH